MYTIVTKYQSGKEFRFVSLLLSIPFSHYSFNISSFVFPFLNPHHCTSQQGIESISGLFDSFSCSFLTVDNTNDL